MNPWNIIGWIVVAMLIIPLSLVAFKLSASLFQKMGNFIQYLRTRNDVPAPGQIWTGDNHSYNVERVMDDGLVVIKSSRVSFNHNAKDWKKFVRNHRLRRVFG